MLELEAAAQIDLRPRPERRTAWTNEDILKIKLDILLQTQGITLIILWLYLRDGSGLASMRTVCVKSVLATTAADAKAAPRKT